MRTIGKWRYTFIAVALSTTVVQGCKSPPDDNHCTEYGGTKEYYELRDDGLKLHSRAWDLFKNGGESNRFTAALFICVQLPVNNEKEKQELVQFWRGIREEKGRDSDDVSNADYCLAILGDVEAEMRLLDKVAKERTDAEQKRLHPAQHFAPNLYFSYGQAYLESRGGNLYLVSLLKSSHLELRCKAWNLLGTGTTFSLPNDLHYDPLKAPGEQREVIERLHRSLMAQGLLGKGP